MPDDPKPNLEGLVIADDTSAGSDSTAPNVSSGASASAGVIEGRRKPRSDAGKPRGPRGANRVESVSAIPPSTFAKLYEPEIWSRALAAPADAMAAVTGRKLWEISPTERQHLGVTGSLAAQVYAVSDPRGLAVALALITIIDIYGIRLMMDLAERRKEREAERKKEKENKA